MLDLYLEILVADRFFPLRAPGTIDDGSTGRRCPKRLQVPPAQIWHGTGNVHPDRRITVIRSVIFSCLAQRQPADFIGRLRLMGCLQC